MIFHRFFTNIRVYVTATATLTAAGVLGFAVIAHADRQSYGSDFKIAPYEIAPYVFSIKGQHIAVGWSKKLSGHLEPASAPDAMLTFFSHGHRKNIKAEFQNGVYSAVLPIPACGFGQVAYQVEGMREPAPISEVPCGNSTQAARFAFLADSQQGVTFDKTFANELQSFPSDAVIFGGDLVQDGSHDNLWVGFFNAVESMLSHQVMIPVMGNHEYRHVKSVPNWKRFFKTEANDAFFAVDIGAAHVMVINSSFEDDPTLRLKEMLWIQSELQKPAAWKIVAFHHPPYSSSILHMAHYPRKEHLHIREDFVPLFETYGVQLVLNGHTHMYEHSFKNGIHYVTTGAAGGKIGVAGAENPYELLRSKERTVIEVEVTPSQLHLAAVTIDGKVLDNLSLDHTPHRD